MAIWRRSNIESLIADAPMSSFTACWQWLRSKVTKETITIMATLMWAAWRCRNVMVFENSEPDAVMVEMGYCNYVAEYAGYTRRVSRQAAHPSSRSATKWKCPAAGCVKFNVDAHLGESAMAALGVVVRDQEGQLILTATRRVPLSSPECIEAQAVRFALMLAKRFDYRKIWVESDALNVINTISCSNFVSIYIGLLTCSNERFMPVVALEKCPPEFKLPFKYQRSR
ncbi:uncharacterized protein LOC110697905 [Chenopodium quinoa]|uniref:uncharacterized protein LOC110697905 n=1 Tax=Chenopodium quinoa TaxID=63459 RepID=UPI000B7795F4|nr:uncharacterized protein LOC110697905 [Chenopodium quinoa]